jgi:hypothetical protein
MLPGPAQKGHGAIIDRLICFLVILASGNPAVELLPRDAQGAAFAAFAGALLLIRHSRKISITLADLFILGAFAALSVVHLLVFGSEVASASASFLVRLTVAFLAIRVTHNFHRHYISVMYLLACISLVFYVPVVMGVDMRTMLESLRLPLPPPHVNVFHIGIHNFHQPEHAMRNSGMFHEPGAFGGYLLLAVVFGALDTAERMSRRTLAVLVIAALTTLSTTTYIALAPALMMLVTANRIATHRPGVHLSMVPAVAVLGFVGWLAFQNLPFLGEKIEAKLEDVRQEQPWARIDRIGNLLYDLDSISKRPLAGWSARHTTRSSIDPEILQTIEGQGNGLSGFAVRYGLLGLLVFAVSALVSFHRLCAHGLLAGLALGVVAILLTGEQYLYQPLFMSLMFIPHALPATATAVVSRGALRGDARNTWRRGHLPWRVATMRHSRAAEAGTAPRVVVTDQQQPQD